MSNAVLDEVRRLSSQGRVRFTGHVINDRGYRFQDNRHHIFSALRNGRAIRASRPDQASDWVVTGPDEDGDDLDVAIVIEADVVVITVF